MEGNRVAIRGECDVVEEDSSEIRRTHDSHHADQGHHLLSERLDGKRGIGTKGLDVSEKNVQIPELLMTREMGCIPLDCAKRGGDQGRTGEGRVGECIGRRNSTSQTRDR